MEGGEMASSHVTFNGPMKDFLSCELRGGVQLPEGVSEVPLLVISEKVGTCEPRVLGKAALKAGNGHYGPLQFLPGHSNYNSMIKSLEGPEVV
jgi:hypothetical protein